jgi:protein-S-isoprenylcysteine O-methyltransferase Ste14
MKETGYLLQAALIAAWWVGLASSQTFFAAFQFDGIPAVAFWSFFAPDVVLIAFLSTLRAYRRVAALEYMIIGAFGYASLYCCNATLLTGSGWLSSGLMLLGLAYNTFLCFSRSLFRSSTSASIPINAAKTFVQIVCIWMLTLVVFPYVILDAFHALTWPRTGFSMWIGVVLFVGFSLLGLASSVVMVRDGGGTPLPLDQTKQLVVSGPYRFVRNPMAIAGIGQGLAVATIFQSVPILVYSLLGAMIWHVVVRPIEEHDMVQRFGRPYLDYRARVTCWIPRFRENATS